MPPHLRSQGGVPNGVAGKCKDHITYHLSSVLTPKYDILPPPKYDILPPCLDPVQRPGFNNSGGDFNNYGRSGGPTDRGRGGGRGGSRG